VLGVFWKSDFFILYFFFLKKKKQNKKLWKFGYEFGEFCWVSSVLEIGFVL